MGRSFSARGTEVASRKYCVAASSFPFRIPLASSTVILFTASAISIMASGAAAVAVRFMAMINESACFFIPKLRITPSAFCNDLGSGILTPALPRNPFPVVSLLVAAMTPWLSACFRPSRASSLERLLIPAEWTWDERRSRQRRIPDARTDLLSRLFRCVILFPN